MRRGRSARSLVRWGVDPVALRGAPGPQRSEDRTHRRGATGSTLAGRRPALMRVLTPAATSEADSKDASVVVNIGSKRARSSYEFIVYVPF